MPVQTLDPTTALVLIDLTEGITALPTVTPADAVVANGALLARAFRDRELPVVLVRVLFSADHGDLLRQRVDRPAPAIAQGPAFETLRAELEQAPSDLVVTKRGWDAFFGTELDLQLRRRGVTGIVLAGISTSIGVESTARHANALGYEIAFAADATTDMVASAHDNAFETIFPRIGQVDTTAAIIAALPAPS